MNIDGYQTKYSWNIKSDPDGITLCCDPYFIIFDQYLESDDRFLLYKTEANKDIYLGKFAFLITLIQEVERRLDDNHE